MARYFVWVTKAWYYNGPQGFYIEADGCKGEISVEWEFLSGGKLCPKLEAFNDAWKLLAKCSDMIKEMSELGDDVSQADFALMLSRLGFIDKTEYKDPNELKKLKGKLDALREQYMKVDARIKELEKQVPF